jgi:hypothetical protein
MLYGTPTRAAHRAAADGGLALLVKTAGATGQHRPPASRTRPKRRALREPQCAARTGHAPREPRRTARNRRVPGGPQRAAHLMTKGLAALIVLGVTGLIGFFIVADHRHGSAAEASTNPDAGEQLSSRAVDAAPLTLEEVFPDPNEVRPGTGTAPYRIVMTHIDSECRIATTGALGPLLEEHDCSQVVRAGMTTPYGDYRVTAGLFNLADADGAAAVEDTVRGLVETGDGSFAAMTAGEPGSDPVAPPASQVGWHHHGHYLLYCVITRPGGAVVPDGDPNAVRITADLVDGYLAEAVLAHRTSSA